MKQSATTNSLKTERARTNLKSHYSEYNSKLEEVMRKHQQIDEKILKAMRKKEEDITLKKEVDNMKLQQLKQFKKHIRRQEDNRKLIIMLREKANEEKIRRINNLQNRVVKTRNDLRIKSLIYR